MGHKYNYKRNMIIKSVGIENDEEGRKTLFMDVSVLSIYPNWNKGPQMRQSSLNETTIFD